MQAVLQAVAVSLHKNQREKFKFAWMTKNVECECIKHNLQ